MVSQKTGNREIPLFKTVPFPVSSSLCRVVIVKNLNGAVVTNLLSIEICDGGLNRKMGIAATVSAS